MKKQPLHELDELHASNQLKEKTLQHVIHHKAKRFSWGMFLPLVSAACIALLFFFSQSNLFIANPPEDNPLDKPVESEIYTYVSVDINPSFELLLNKEGNVIDIKTYNEDANVVLKDYDFKDKNAQIVLKEIILLPNFQEYLKLGYLQVSIFSDDKSTSQSMESILDATLAQVLDRSQFGCICASKQDKESADEHHMSFGKYQLINEITSKDSAYTITDLQSYSMRELKDLYETLFEDQYLYPSHNGGKHHQHNRGNKKSKD